MEPIYLKRGAAPPFIFHARNYGNNTDDYILIAVDATDPSYIARLYQQGEHYLDLQVYSKGDSTLLFYVTFVKNDESNILIQEVEIVQRWPGLSKKLVSKYICGVVAYVKEGLNYFIIEYETYNNYIETDYEFKKIINDSDRSVSIPTEFRVQARTINRTGFKSILSYVEEHKNEVYEMLYLEHKYKENIRTNNIGIANKYALAVNNISRKLFAHITFPDVPPDTKPAVYAPITSVTGEYTDNSIFEGGSLAMTLRF